MDKLDTKDKPHPMDVGIARWLKSNRCTRDAAVYLRQFGWSLDAARCILLAPNRDRKPR